MSGPKKLVIYDFDWTLMRSPLPPAGVFRWWDDPVSLHPPVLPKRPSEEWWIEEVVSEMKNDQRQKQTVTAVVTGRRGKQIRGRVQELLKQQRLRPDYLRFHDDIRGPRYPGAVLAHKVKTMDKILRSHPTITELEVWEDKESQLVVFGMAAKKRGLQYSPHLVIDQESR